MTFTYRKPLHRGKLMRPRCVGNLKRAYIFIAAYHLKYRIIIVPFHYLFILCHASRRTHSTGLNNFTNEAFILFFFSKLLQ